MGGGLLQLVLVGYQDSFLIHQPTITYFRQVYKRHTNFAVEAIPQYFNVKPDFGSRVTCTIAKNADLISRMYLVVNLPPIGRFLDYPGEEGEGNGRIAQCAWVEKIGFQLIRQVELEIAGQVIDRHYGDYLNIWSELTTSLAHKRGLDKMIGNVPELTEFSNGKKGYQLYVPLMFWFCRHPNLALPLVALENADVKINVEFNGLDDCLILAPSHYMTVEEDLVELRKGELLVQQVKNMTYYAKFIYYDILTKRLYYTKITPEPFEVGTAITGQTSRYAVTPDGGERLYLDKNRYFTHVLNLSLGSAHLLVDFVYLDIVERLKFLKSNHEYLIDVVQFDNDRLVFHSNNKVKIGYSNPCKEIIFRGQYDYLAQGYLKQKFNYMNRPTGVPGESILKRARLLLNGQERVRDKAASFYEWVQVFQSHRSDGPEGVSVYSFALTPEGVQSSGSCNFSKMDDIVLEVTVDKGVSYNRPVKLRVYALTYSVMKIVDGIVSMVF